MIYLDHQASTPMRARAIQALVRDCQEYFANPHAEDHLPGWAASEAVERARWSISTVLGADPDELFFTSGATEANNLAILGTVQDGPPGRIVVSAIEHEAVLAPAVELRRRGFDVVYAPVGSDGVVDVGRFIDLLVPGTLLASVMLVNNEIGTVQPIAELAAACEARGVVLHVDAVQGLGWMAIDVSASGIDLLSVSAHKVGGPKGVGALYVRRELRDRIRPLMFGGGQEGGMRAGTLPVPLCTSFGVACEELPDALAVTKWRERTQAFASRLVRLGAGGRLNGGGHPGNVSITFPGVDADLLVARLRPVVAVSRGSACTSGVPSQSHVLRAIGLSAADCASTIRLSTAPETTARELERAIDEFAEGLQAARV